MANVTITSESSPGSGYGGPGCRWYKPSTHQWHNYNPATSQWDLGLDGFDAVRVVDLTVSGSITSGDDPGITGTFEGTFKKVKIKNGIITEFELDE